MTRLPSPMRDLLNGCGLPWRVTTGKKHYKVIVGRRLCAIFPKGGQPGVGRSLQNSLAQIRRAIKEQKR